MSLETDHSDTTKTAQHASTQHTQQIGPYKTLEVLGEGGMGVVYRAQQTKPVKREVALKLIKLGMDTKQVIARFESERQALALMDHPNVAKVFDAGATEQGRPYFVMELVHGLPITEHCDRHKLTIDQRLDLFMKTCEAIQHAHQKGIIHRDIKPGNILVEYRDGQAIPKIIDFGVAKATSQRLTEKTLFTEQGQMVGTPAYMSPEQADLSSQDIDTRSDIYSLGVLLYELLTGTLPFDAKSLRSAGFGEIQRIIRDEQPRKPSTRMSDLQSEPRPSGSGPVRDDVSDRPLPPEPRASARADARGRKTAQAEACGSALEVARRRRSDPHSLIKRIRGDLDWIVLKCLEKDRARRYETASGLASDIRRHLTNEPVLASPPSTGYRFKKFIRRNRGPVTAVTAVLIALAVGLAMTVHLYVQAENARAETVVQRDHAKREAETAKQVQQFLIDLFKVSDPSEAKGNTITAREIMDRGAERIGRELSGQPLIQATLLHTVSSAYRALGLYDKALPLARQALRIRRQARGDEHLDVAQSLHGLAHVLDNQGKYIEAEGLVRQALGIQRRLLGDEHLDVVGSLNNLARVLYSQGKYAEAEKLARQGLATRRKLFGDEHPDVAHSLNLRAAVLSRQGKHAEAEKLARQGLATRRKLFGDEHPDVAQSLNTLAVVLSLQGKHAEAEKLYHEALAVLRKFLRDEHPDVADCISNLANALGNQGKYAEAEKLHREALAMRCKLLGDEHPAVAASLNILASVLRRQGKHAEAEKLLRQALAMKRKLLGDEHPGVLPSLHNLAVVVYEQGKYAEAETLHREALGMRRKLLGDEHPSVARSLRGLVDVLKAQGKFEKARPFAAELLAKRRKRAEKPEASANELNAYAWDLLTIEPADLRDPPAALPLAQRAVEFSGNKNSGILDTLALAQHMTGDIDAAVETERTAVALLPQGPSPLRTEFETNLTKFLIAQGVYGEAEPLLLALYQQLNDNPESSAKQNREAIGRIIHLYESRHAAEPGTGYDAKAAEWRAKLSSEQPNPAKKKKSRPDSGST